MLSCHLHRLPFHLHRHKEQTCKNQVKRTHRSPMEAAAPNYAAKAKRDPNCHRPKLIPQNEFEERIRKQRDKKNARDSERKKRRRQEQHDGVSKAG